MRDYISAVYLMAAPPRDQDAIIPEGFVITKLPAKVAAGLKRPTGGAIVGGTSPKWSAITPRGNSVRGLAARGW